MSSLLAASSRCLNMWRTDATQHLQKSSLIIGKIKTIFTKSGWWNNHLLQNLIFMIQSCLDYQIPRKKERSRLAANVTIKPNLCENPTYTTIGTVPVDSDNLFYLLNRPNVTINLHLCKRFWIQSRNDWKKETSGKDNKIGGYNLQVFFSKERDEKRKYWMSGLDRS